MFYFISTVVTIGTKGAGIDAATDALVVQHFDRTAPLGTGTYKIAGNYGPVLRHQLAAKNEGFGITLHLDSATRTLIDEFSTSNFLAIQYQGEEGKDEKTTTLVVPKSNSILESITTKSVIDVARERFGWNVEQRGVAFEEVLQRKFGEVAAIGTAAAVTPVRSISYEKDMSKPGEYTKIEIGDGQKAGQGWINMRSELTAIQCGDSADDWGWLWPKEGVERK